jgi:hypothetical protein
MTIIGIFMESIYPNIVFLCTIYPTIPLESSGRVTESQFQSELCKLIELNLLADLSRLIATAAKNYLGT